MNTALHLLGYKAESFFVTDASQGQAQTRPEVLSTIVISIILFLVFGIIFCYGAAKLSYNYNMSIGNGGSAFFWSIVCFLFANIYYPYYALILSPVSGNAPLTGGGATATMTGGKRTKSK
jgi:ABC-type dipeptide/oligopeptide/nickel transport system permease component